MPTKSRSRRICEPRRINRGRQNPSKSVWDELNVKYLMKYATIKLKESW